MSIKKTTLSQSTDYTVCYADMRGVDFSPAATDRRRFSYLENMYRDYASSGAGVTESIPGFRKIASLGGRIHGIYSHKDSSGREHLVVHSADMLYRFPIDALDSEKDLYPISNLGDNKSSGFLFGGKLFLLDGENITVVSENGETKQVLDQGAAPYIPTLYYNGVRGEQRNLLTHRFYEKYLIESPDSYASGTDAIKYEVISESEKTCRAVGVSASHEGELRLPHRVKIGNEYYLVTEIAAGAFKDNKKITDLYISEGCLKIGSYAFSGCSALRYIVTPNSLDEIGEYAFGAIEKIMYFYLGSSVRRLGENIFDQSTVLSLSYAKNQATFEKIEGFEQLSETNLNYNAVYSMIEIELALISSVKEVRAVTLNGEAINYTVKKNGDVITAVLIAHNRKSELTGAEILISLEGFSAKDSPDGKAPFFCELGDEKIDGKDAILGCTVCENFDGRVFLSGNPKLPNTVFYSARDTSGRNNPLYFGELNYFSDGTGPFGVCSLLAAADSLAVFKSGDDGGGSIYYHTPLETGDDFLPKVYPVSYIHSGICSSGASISFFDDPIFISPLGICALGKKAINLERSIAIRSHNINAKLLSENLEEISLAKWCGYLVVAAGKNYYLADSRQIFTHETGNPEYEWYYLSGIGTYTDDHPVFIYSYDSDEHSKIHERAGEKIENYKSVWSETDGSGKTLYYTIEDAERYRAEKTEERTGGIFSPSICTFATGELLFFGTGSGDICVFNNDKRAVAPPLLLGDAGFDEEEYKRQNAGKIHPYYYSFDSHAPRYALMTVSDDGNVAHLTKNTVKDSLTVKLRHFGRAKFICEAATEKRGWVELCELKDNGISFDELDFSSLSFENKEYLTLPIKERERGWVEKRISLYSDAFRAPFGVSNLSYRFRVKGKIKLK